MARLLGTDTPEGAARFERLAALRDSGYSGPIDQDGNIPAADHVAVPILEHMRRMAS